MEYAFERWYKAILVRQSCRQYDRRLINPDTLLNLYQFADSLNESFGGVRVVISKENPEEVFKGAVGSYGKIIGAPSYAAFIGDMNDKHVQEKIGHAGELFVLEATSIGLGTCWIAGFFRPEVVKKQIDLTNNEKVLSVTPIGYASKQQKTWDKRLMSFLVKSRKRKELDVLCTGLDKSKWPDWARSALECARLAPSAINRQPWRFMIEHSSITVYLDSSSHFDGSVSKRLDCGIAMSHLEIGAGIKGKRGTWTYLESPKVAVFKIDC